MSNKNKFTIEFELRASPKVLYPYVSTPSGLQQWFCDKVNYKTDSSFDFVWDGDSHRAKVSSQRTNKSIRFDFALESNEDEASYLEFKLDLSELTQSTFLRVTDYSSNTDNDDLKSLWHGLIERLKEIVGS